MPLTASLIVRAGFPFLSALVASVVVVLLGVAVTRRHGAAKGRLAWVQSSAAALVWLAVPAALSLAGALVRFDARPPPLMIVVVALVLATFAVAFSKFGDALAETTPYAWLIGVQAFRLPLELLMHRAASDGLMPIQMSYSGYNFDIATGITAALLALTLHYRRERAPRWLVVAWNALGTVLLVNIVTIAVVSMPMIQAFGPERENRFVAYFPYVWLPTVLVPAALFGHLVVWRKLLIEVRQSRSLGSRASA